MSTINFGGLASGLDTNAIVTGLLGVEKIPLQQLQARQANVDSAKTTITGISDKLAALKTAALALSTAAGFSSFSATSSDSAIVATVTGAAAPGSFDLQVTQLAKEQRTYSDVQTSSVVPLNLNGTLDLQVGSGTPAHLDILATDSLTDIAAKIGSSGARVAAAVIFDGTNYKLQVRGLDTGLANAVSMTETGFSLGLANPANTVQKSQDAKLTLDGINVTRSNNQVVGLLPGLTLALTRVTTTPVTVTAAPDPSNLSTKIQALVSAYNDTVSASHFAAGYGSIKASNPELMGDSSIRSTLQRLSSSIAGVIPGSASGYTTLASVGLSTTRDGVLALDTTKLTAALQANPSAVSALFVQDPQAGTTGAMKSLMSTIDSLATNTGSVLGTRIATLGKLSTRLGDDQDAVNRHLTLYEATLRKRFTDLETQMSAINSNGSALLAAIGAGNTSK